MSRLTLWPISRPAASRAARCIIVGEDYGDGSSIMQERSHAFAMKSQMWLLDPRPNLPSIVRAVEQGFELSEATQHAGDARIANPRLPRPRPLHRQRQCAPEIHAEGRDGESGSRRQPHRAAPGKLPCTSRRKSSKRWPAAQKYHPRARLNEIFAEGAQDFGIILQGGMYNTTMRCLEFWGCRMRLATARSRITF